MKSPAVLLSLALLAPVAASAQTSTLIKSADNPAVYLVQDGLRHPFPLLSVYKSWYGDTFQNVLDVSVDSLANYQLGKNVKFKPGTLIKIQTDPKVYLVKDEAGNLEWIKTEQDFLARGLKFSDVHDVPDTFFPDYTVQPDSYFATPSQASTSTPAPAPTIPAPNKSAQILSVKSAANKNENNKSAIDYTVTTDADAPLTFSYQVLGAATTTKSFVGGTLHTGTIVAGLGELVPYHIEAGTAPNSSTKDGILYGYSDFTIVPSKFAPVAASVFQPVLRLGSFSVKNNSAAARAISTVSFVFDATTLASDDPTKTLEVRSIDSNGAIIKSFGELMIGAGRSVLGRTNPQTLRLDEELAPGETRTYELVGRYFDALNKDRYVSTDTMTVTLDNITGPGDSTTIITNHTIGTLKYSN